MSLLLHGARKLDADGIVDDFWLLVEGDRIEAVGTGDSWRTRVPSPDGGETRSFEIVDAAGAWLTPGFIDLHVHGAGGHSFDDGHDAILAGLAVHRRHGTTRSAVSLVANPPHELEASLDAIARLARVDPLVLGAHLEGPFLAPARKGAHDAAFLGHPTPHLVRDLVAAGQGSLLQITIAPELPDALTAIATFAEAGVVVAVGHTDASFDEARAAFDRGATLLTHAFNAMPGIHHRDPGPLVAAFDDPRVVLELIADGVHVHPAVVELAFRSAPGRIALITDAMAATCSSDGDYRLGSREVTVQVGRARLTGTDTIAGSTLTQDAALRTAVTAGVDPVAAITALTATPARAIGRRHELGALRPGLVADLVLLTPAFEVVDVIAAGQRQSPRPV
ncbi:N-acetylglucosamine-6-phosphate deacetylase [Herbiconiux liukaitaii]|uniref:N-acetylglucosamine-6-phosphate deacetylase n=1 Tax=Herbiconiux liukaitaii TaxID=3342799 RepID=UPI0035B7F71A